MGLDNGVHLIVKEKLDLDDWMIFPEWAKIEFDEYSTEHYKDGYYYDICYWRKCWDLRERLMSAIDGKDQSKSPIDKPSQIDGMIDEIIYYLKNPEEWDRSIWELDEIVPILAQDIINLGWLKKYMEEHPKARAEFYDSY